MILYIFSVENFDDDDDDSISFSLWLFSFASLNSSPVVPLPDILVNERIVHFAAASATATSLTLSHSPFNVIFIQAHRNLDTFCVLCCINKSCFSFALSRWCVCVLFNFRTDNDRNIFISHDSHQIQFFQQFISSTYFCVFDVRSHFALT